MNLGLPDSGDPWARLVDDASLFPPGELPFPDALPAHTAHHAAWYARLVGPFVLPAPRAAQLAAAAGANGTGEGFEVILTLPGGPDHLVPALGHLAGLAAVQVAAVETPVPDGMAPGDLIGTLDRVLPESVRASIELPRSVGGTEVLEALADSRYQAKLRTGGTEAAAFPDARELATTIVACVRFGLSFKCTAGLHRAVGHRDPETGFAHHGFVNVLLATAAALGGDGPDAVADVLARRSREQLLADCAALGPGGLGAARALFTSFGSCSVAEPVEDLVHLGLLEPPAPTGGETT